MARCRATSAAMTIIAERRYRKGKPVGPALEGAMPAQGEFDWIGLHEPDADEIARVQQRYGLHPLAVEDAMGSHQVPKAESYGEQLFVVARTAAFSEGETITYGQTAVFLGKRFIITVRQGSTRAHSKLRDAVEQYPERLSEGPDFVLHAVLDFIVDGYTPLLDRLDEAAAEMEEGAVASFPDHARIRRIFRLRRAMRRFSRVAEQMEEVAAKLTKVDLACVDTSARPYFRDVYDHARRAASRAKGLNETLGSIVEMAGLLEQARQGRTTRQLAAWAAILAVPTAIAGIYGMNFDFMPELEWRYGYFVVLGVTAALCLALFVRFRRIGWL
jgi:magnesium transporter